MQFTAEQIATMLGGEIVGDKDRTIKNVAGLETAKEGDLCFLGDEKYLPYLSATKASVVLMTQTLPFEGETQATIIRVANARGAMAQLLQAVADVLNPKRRGVEQPTFVAEGVDIPQDAYIGAMAYIGKNVKLGKGVQIYPQVYLGDNVVVGDNTILYPGVRVYYNCKIGQRCILHAGVVIGADGFGFEPDAQGVLQKVPQIGCVVVEDDVEIGANTTIDRAMMGETRVKKNTKLDNLVQIGHNVQIGESTVLCAQAGVAGSTTIGNHCMLTGQVGVAGHIEITDNCVIGAQSGVTNNLKKPGMYLGSPAMDAGQCRRVYAVMRQLPELYKKVK